MGKFITIEGIEGAGKSTVIQYITEYFKKLDQDIVVTREPGGTEIAEAIRELLLTPHQETMTAETELLLMFAGRAQHIASVIEPALSAGKWVLSDRFTDASFAYQGGGREMPLDKIEAIATWLHKDLMPDLTIVLDLPLTVSHDRTKAREKDRIEKESDAFFQRVRQVYLDRAGQYPERFRVVDASQSLSVVQSDILQVLDYFVGIDS